MQPHPAGSAAERLWADEVLRLHALWRRGPPRAAGPSPKPSAAAAAALGPSSSATFKRAERRTKRKAEKMQRRTAKKMAEQLRLGPEEAPPRESDGAVGAAPSEIEWPCEPLPVRQPDAGWGEPSRQPAPSSAREQPMSEEEQAKLASSRVHQKALRTCQGFLSRGGSSDGEEEDEEEEEDQMEEDGDGVGEGCGGVGDREGSGCFDFFLGLFEKDGELRAYYEKNWEKGEFCCLVCEGIGVKVGKRFVDCVALVQHASSITKTKRKAAHRAFGRAICRVLGWDITRLPSIVLDMGETLGQTLEKATGLQDGISKQSDEILVDASEVNVTDHVDHSNHLEADDIPEKPMEMPSSEVKWMCETSPVSLREAEWGDSDQRHPLLVQALPASQEEQERLATMQIHRKALRASQDYFLQRSSSDIEQEDEEDDGLMDEDGDGDEVGNVCMGGEDQEGSKYFNLFLSLFEEDGNLRAYYEKNWEKGEFYCFVCEGIAVKVGKRFMDCVALVQHSSSITKTKRREAHRAFGRVICHVLGWDISRLPSIALDTGETLGQAMARATVPKDDTPKQSDDILVDASQAGGTDLGNHISHLEADDNIERCRS